MPAPLPPVFVVPNFHPASSGWLANWSAERNHCANTYLLHLDRVAADPAYRFVFSEVNNLIAVLNFRPDRFEELKRRVHEGRVELVNGFFIEATMSLGGGELYARLGVEGMRWQEALLGTRPRFAWCIDICGTPDQQAQLTAQLGLEGLVFTRNNRREADANAFHGVSPDGTRIPVVAPTHYSDFGTEGLCHLFGKPSPLDAAELAELHHYFSVRARATPPGAPVLILGGKGDYSGPPVNPAYPSAFLREWAAAYPGTPLRFATFADYFDALAPALPGLLTQPVSTPYTWSAFWVQNPRAKAWFRRCEHALQSAETTAALASLLAPATFPYPARALHHAWHLLFLNADRNTLWGAAGGMVFEHPTSWDARDRFEWVESHSALITAEALHALASPATPLAPAAPAAHPAEASPTTPPTPPLPGLFNPLAWPRHDPVEGDIQPSLPAFGFAPAPAPAPERPVPVVPAEIVATHYVARLDPATGELLGLRALPSGRELLGGPANRLVAEKAARPEWYAAGDNLHLRPERPRLAASHEFPATLRAWETDLSLTVEIHSTFLGGGLSRRLVRFHKNYPRIDFETELHDLPDETVVLAEFPLADTPSEVRRGIPFGFSHAAWPEPRPGLDGIAAGILPAIRYSDYQLPSGAALALLDRGVPARELTDRTAALLLLNTVENYYGYPNPWLSGAGPHRFAYALAVRDTDWAHAAIPRLAWEFNQPPVRCALPSSLPHASPPTAASPRIHTSPNLLVEVLRRDGPDLELRLVEIHGLAGPATVTLDLPHEAAALTDFHGHHPRLLAGGPAYAFDVRPQEIVTLRFRTATPAPSVPPLTDWSPLVPPDKQAALRAYLPDVVGHPPRGT